MSAKCIWVLTGIFWNITFVNHKINVQEAATVKCADQLEQGGFAMVSMINKAILRKDLGKLPSVKGMVRKSDVMAVVGKQKELFLEPDVLFDSIKELKEEYHSTGEFVVNGTTYSMEQMMEELRNDTGIGREFRKAVNKNVLTYMMKFGGDED